MTDAAGDPHADSPAPSSARRRWHRAGLAATVVLVAAVVAALPFAARSMGEQLFGRERAARYDLLTGRAVTPADAARTANHESFFNVAVLGIDEGAGSVTLAVSGNRVCPGACPTTRVTLFSLADDADVRQGLPPSATLPLDPGDLHFTETLTLPIRGQPSLYPFETWTLWLGLSGGDVGADGALAPLTAAEVERRAAITVQNQTGDFRMAAPVAIAPDSVRAAADAAPFVAVQGLAFARPDYLRVLAAVLVLLITVSGLLALLTRTVGDLLLGVGGLILGVWGVRSIIVPQPVPVATAVDLVLTLVILVLLLGVVVRVARHLHRGSELAWTRR